MGNEMNAAVFFSGITLATFAAAGLFFYKFWKASLDRFFLYFAVSFWLIALERIVAFFYGATFAVVWSEEVDAVAWVYFLRLLAFAAILLAFFEKNREAKR